METNHDHHQLEDDEIGQGEQGGQALPGTEEWLIPGVPIVRDSTPRAFSFDLPSSEQGQKQDRSSTAREPAQPAAAAFPIRAPVAPPLPEECEEGEGETIDMVEATPLPLSGSLRSSDEALPEFLWLFEYSLEMDSAILNAPDRLDGYALLYGPAALKGYRLAFNAIESPQGKPLITLVPDAERGAAVWGVLYRIPARLAMRHADGASLLDKIHFAAPPAPLFEAVTVVARETYRQREIVCTTYMATLAALLQFRQQHEWEREDGTALNPDSAFARRLLEIARQRTLPDEYVQELAAQVARAAQAANLTTTQSAPDSVPDVPGESTELPEHPAREQNTEPLPTITDKKKASPTPSAGQDGLSASRPDSGMMAFAIYLAMLLLLVLALAVLQGMGFASAVFTASFTPLGVPWFVLVYGLLGGCASSIITLGRRGRAYLTERAEMVVPPNFVLVTWFTRPFIGSLLAMLAYLLVNSGLLALSGNGVHSSALFSLLAVLAGLMEGWIFCRKG